MLFIHEYQHSNRRCTSRGPTLRFNQDTTIAIAGKFENATLNGKVFDSFFEPVSISAGDVLKMGTVTGSTMRGYLAVQGGGIDVPEYLNSKSTLALGNLGGFQGRPLVPGDNLRFTDDVSSTWCSSVEFEKITLSYVQEYHSYCSLIPSLENLCGLDQQVQLNPM